MTTLVPEIIVGVGQVAEATGKAIDLAGRVMAPKASKAAPIEPPVYDKCELKTITLHVDDGSVDLEFSCRRQNSDGSLAPPRPVTLSTSSVELAKVVSAGSQALNLLGEPDGRPDPSLPPSRST